jgi:outer membrane protein insertion porin family
VVQADADASAREEQTRPSEPASSAAAVTPDMDHSVPTHVRQIQITGNTITREDVVRREIQQPENAGYDPKMVEESVQRLQRTGYFSNVTASLSPVDGEPGVVDVNIQVAEKPEVTLRASLGYSSTDRVVGSASVSYLNVAGSGHDLNADVAVGQSFQSASISESSRGMVGSGIGHTTRLWYQAGEPLRYLSGSRFRTAGLGLGVRFDMPVDARNTVYIEPGFEHNRLSIDPLTPQAYQDYVTRFGRTSNTVTLAAGWIYDSRDSVSYPTSGLLAQGRVEYGFGLHYIKTVGSLRYYHPMSESSVLSLSLRGSAGTSFGSRDYPLQKLDYAGGAASVRGYVANSLGARDVKTGDPLGGQRTLTGSIQAGTEVARLGDRGRVVSFAFVDGGTVGGAPGSSLTHAAGAGGSRFSYGIGLGWQAPFGSLGASFALPFKRHDGDRYQPFQVNFTAAF